MAYALLRPLLFSLDAETAHGFTLGTLDALRRIGLPRPALSAAGCSRRVMGLDFPNPVGLAAGLDKNAEHIDALAALGFGFIEVGTVTPRPQPGNPRPRLFRVKAARAVINRMGFNNLGVDRLVENVKRARFRGVLGVNIGKNFDTPLERAADDYIACLRKVYTLADYVTVNISSPNTAGLRQLQESPRLESLLSAIAAERRRLADQHGRRVPIAVKVAPDLDDAQIGDIARLLPQRDIDAVIATNTTLDHHALAGLPHGGETGGVSGAPLTQRATAVVRALAAKLGGALPVIGVGGIMSGTDAADKIAAGASLVQIYSGLIYRGPALIADCIAALCGEKD
jgi:dihydroorotate dehydrogenase